MLQHHYRLMDIQQRRVRVRLKSALSDGAAGQAAYLAMQTYSFPALCCALTRRVARSMHTIRLPVTLGSSVPLCPVFSTRIMRLIHATTSWEEGLAGLSRFMHPGGMHKTGAASGCSWAAGQPIVAKVAGQKQLEKGYVLVARV